jgi:hypothetical protein
LALCEGGGSSCSTCSTCNGCLTFRWAALLDDYATRDLFGRCPTYTVAHSATVVVSSPWTNSHAMDSLPQCQMGDLIQDRWQQMHLSCVHYHGMGWHILTHHCLDTPPALTGPGEVVWVKPCCAMPCMLQLLVHGRHDVQVSSVPTVRVESSGCFKR